MVDKRVEHDFILMSVVAVVAVIAMFSLISPSSMGDTSITGNVIGEARAIPPPLCEDTDAGMDYSTKGRLSGDIPSGFYSEDRCFMKYFLREVYCKDNRAASHTTYCRTGCENGMCKEKKIQQKCGDGVFIGWERCDGANLGDKTCNSLGYIGGALSCTKYCILNTSGCTKPVCGNNVKEAYEICDGNDLNNKTCRRFGFVGGTLKCSNCQYNMTGCVKICSSDAECGMRICAGVKVHETCENGRCVFKSSCTATITTKCAKEGEYTSGTVAPEYQFNCCEGLKGFNTNPNLVGRGSLCYNPEKGTPVCEKQGTRSEGWYYPKTGQLLKYETCPSKEESYCKDSDNGKEYAILGKCNEVQVNPVTGTMGASIIIDTCTDARTLKECYCEGTDLKTIDYACPSGCANGACIKETGSCVDTDGGKNYAVKGTIKNSYGISATDGCGTRISTLCGDGISPIGDNECLKKALVEYYCGGDSVSSPIKINDIIKLDNMDCIYIGYAVDGYVSIGCGTSGIQRAPMGADGGFTITQPMTGKAYKFYVINLGTANSNIRAAEPLLMFENIKCPYTCVDGACVEQRINITFCGDGMISPGEECDGAKLNGMTCGDFEFDGGTLGCAASCKFDTTKCTRAMPCTTYMDCPQPAPAPENYRECNGSSVCKVSGGYDCINNKCVLNKNFYDCLPCSGGCSRGAYAGAASCTPPININFCGDSVKNGVEECDDADLNNKSCVSLGFDGGVLKCNNQCKFDMTACSDREPVCGDGIVQKPNSVGFSEECDGDIFIEPLNICPPGSTGGPVSCKDCRLDYSLCKPIPEPGCGDGVRQAELGEDCDGADFDGKTCINMGYAGGSLSCTHGCLIDTTGCTWPPKVCGDGIVSKPNDVDFTEQCDGVVVGIGCPPEYYGGSVLCTRACTYDYSNCTSVQPPRCGDGYVNTPNEQCDGGDLNWQSCVSRGFTRGDLACGDNCMFDESYCTTDTPPRCGDNFVNQNFEYCDGTDLNENSCESRGFVSGTLSCTGSCSFDPRGCSMCNNNGVCQPRTGETAENCEGDCVVSPVGVSLYLNPGSIDVATGDTVSFDIDVSNVNSLFGYQFDLNYDLELLEFIGLEDGDFLSTTQSRPFCVEYTASPGLVENVACTKVGGSGVSGNGLLKKVNFRALARGNPSNIVLSNVKLVDATAATISAQVLSGQVSIS